MGLVFRPRVVAEAKPRPSIWSKKGRGMKMGPTKGDTRSWEPEKKGMQRRLERAWLRRQEERG